MAPSVARIEKEVTKICRTALASGGDVNHITVKYLIKTVSQQLQCDAAEVAKHKQHIKDLASRLLNEEADEPVEAEPEDPFESEEVEEVAEVADVEEEPTASTSKGKRKQTIAATSDGDEPEVSKPKKKASKKAASDDEVQAVEEPAKKKRKSDSKAAKSKPSKTAYKSAEFINSEGDPISAPAVPSDEEPPKKKKRVSKSTDDAEKPKKESKPKAKKATSDESKPKAKKAAAGEEDEEVTRLKGFIKACGVRFMQKEIADMSVKEQQKYLKAKLAELGMTGRLSLAKAKEIKAKRELDKEMADLQASGAPDVEATSGRKTRNLRQKDEDEGWTRKKVKSRVVDSDEEEEGSDEPELDEKAKRKVDRQTKRNVDAFFGSIGGVKGLLGDMDML